MTSEARPDTQSKYHHSIRTLPIAPLTLIRTNSNFTLT